MNKSTKLHILKTMCDSACCENNDDDLLLTYLQIAGSKVCRRLYPYDLTVCEVPDAYAMTQIQIAAYLINKRGAEGESAHAENGISRTYEDGDIPASLYRDIVPFAEVIGGGDYHADHGKK